MRKGMLRFRRMKKITNWIYPIMDCPSMKSMSMARVSLAATAPLPSKIQQCGCKQLRVDDYPQS